MLQMMMWSRFMYTRMIRDWPFRRHSHTDSCPRMKVDNMREEHQEKLIRDAEKVAEQQANEEAAHEEKQPRRARKVMGFIAVSIGEGMNEIFRELGVDYLIEGGQTMNPSTEDMLTAIDAGQCRSHVFILPNNKNIVLAANQAKASDKGQRYHRDSDKDSSTGNYSDHQLYAGSRTLIPTWRPCWKRSRM